MPQTVLQTVEVLAQHGREIAVDWVAELRAAGVLTDRRIDERELAEQTQQLIRLLGDCLRTGRADLAAAEWAPVRTLLDDWSRTRVA